MYFNTYMLLIWLTCFYWIISLFILFLRIFQPQFRNITRYGGRYENELITNNNNNSKINNFFLMRIIQKIYFIQWFCNLFTKGFHILERSPFCSIKVSRKYSFCTFYLTGIISCITLFYFDYYFHSVYSNKIIINNNFLFSLNDSLCYFESLPLFAFFIHCIIRLWECLYLHCFRGGLKDCVTLFAAVAGCSFYIFAAISNSFIIFHITQDSLINENFDFDLNQNLKKTNLYLKNEKIIIIIIVILFILHIFFQVLQVIHHGVLAKLRDDSVILNSYPLKNKNFKKYKLKNENNNIVKKQTFKNELSYRFPNKYLFLYVLEPHYTCEIMMYFVNLIGIWILIFYATPLIDNIYRENDKEINKIYLLANYMTPLGVMLFSLFNLSITANEHRNFWNHLNKLKKNENQIPQWNMFYYLW